MSERVLYQFCGAGEMPGGVQDSTNSIAGYMRDQGIDIHVLVGSTENLEGTAERFSSFEPENNIHVLGGANHYAVINGSQNPLGSFIRPQTIKHAVESLQPDVFHINAPWMPHVGGVALRQAQRRDIPTVATYHIVSDERLTNAALKATGVINRGRIQALDAMIAVSEPARQHMEMTYRYKGDIKIIPNGVDVERLEQAKPFEANEPFEGFDPDRPTIVFVGRPDPRKGLDELLPTFKLVTQDFPDAQLIICGGNKTGDEIASDESLRKYHDLSTELDIASSTHFMGRVSDEDKARWFASADIAVLPAIGNESQGIVLLEAMAAGARVVVGGNNAGYASVFNPEDVRSSDLMLVDPKDHDSFKEQLVMLLDSDCVAHELHVEQQQLVRRKYDIQWVGRQILDLYRSLV